MAAAKSKADKATKPAQKKKRKSRTQVSSSESSSAPSSDSESAAASSRGSSPGPVDERTVERRTQAPAEPPVSAGQGQAGEAFANFYLQQSTREFAADLDKLRTAGDFHGESSVPVLVAALRQGTGCFTEEERRRIGGAALE